MSAKLNSSLTYGLLHHPALLSELPLLINSFDKNETVLLQQVENVQYRDYLLQLMKLLPVITDGTGSYSKHPSVNSVGNWILEELAKSKSISQPNKLTEAQIMSSRTFPVYLFSILEKFPALIDDLPTLFQTLLNGEEIDLSDMDDEDVKESLQKLFESVGIKDLTGEDKYCVQASNPKYSMLKQVLVDIVEMFKSFKRGELSLYPEKSSEPLPKKAKHKSSASASSSSSSSSSSSDDSESDKEEAQQQEQQVGIGPALPTLTQLQSAQLAAEEYLSLMNDESEVIGPSYDMSTQVKGDVPDDDPIGGKQVASVNVEIESSVVAGREEWMMTPGENKALGDLEASMVLKNRTFLQGRNAGKIGGNAPPAAPLTAAEIEEQARAQKLIDEFNKSRGPSLMEQHLEKMSQQKGGPAKPRKAFDRDSDFGSHRAVSKLQVEVMREEAKKAMNMKFSKPNLQR